MPLAGARGAVQCGSACPASAARILGRPTPAPTAALAAEHPVQEVGVERVVLLVADE